MIYKAKIGLLSNIVKLSRKAEISDNSYYYDICNVIVSEFDFYAVVLFKHLGNRNLEVLGKSNSVKKDFDDSKNFSCRSCRIFPSSEDFSISSDPKCEINITEILTYESCCLFKVSDSEEFLLKLAKKSPFTDEDKNSIKIIADFISSLKNKSIANLGKAIQVEEPVNKGYNKVISDSIVEMRNFTNSIIGFNSSISKENLSITQQDDLRNISNEGKDIRALLGDLIELLKKSHDKSNPPLKEFDLKVLIQDLIDLFNKKKEVNHNEFKFEIKSKHSFNVQTDETKLRYILNTLLSICNAFTNDGLVFCTVNLLSETKIELKVSDNGFGISDEKKKSLSEPSVSSKIQELSKTNLTGISLLLAEKYINELGGELSFKTVPGNGTEFTFSIKGKVTSTLETAMNELPKPEKEAKVLLIEDDYATVKLLTNYLQKWGYTPVVVNNAEDTFKKIREEKFVAAILDIELPQYNGLELLKKIHEIPEGKNLPVIVSSVEHEEQKAFLLGAVEYFVKPINYKFLVEVLQNYKLKKNSNVLCVDDDFASLSLVKEAIQDAGFNAIAENISANVLESIKDKEVDLAIVDLDMPYPNGFELIKQIKSQSRFANLPIIIYTGKENYAEDLKQIDGMFEGLLDKKSTSFESLGDTIRGMINRYETVPPVEEVIEKEDVIKILLAEDYKHSQIIVTRMLKKNGFENIVVVENGDEALSFAKKENFNLILMDMQMPIMNGFEATQKIREIPEYKNTPIIALTAFAMKGDKEKCLDAGATDYIPKPIDGKEFIEKVKQYTSQK